MKPKFYIVITLLVCTLFSSGLQAQNYTINTFAGHYTGGLGAYNGDGGQATAAQLNVPNGVAVDASGNVYISDSYNNVIRKVNTSGIISTFAGNGFDADSGKGGYTGDGGQATLAELAAPSNVAVDDSGNVFIADYLNSVIRKVRTNGIISTVAGNGTFGETGDGGAATVAELDGPSGLAIDASGNIYFAEYYGNRVRKVGTNGIITTIAGNGTNGYKGDGGLADIAELNYPEGVALDDTGNIYVVDGSNYVVRKINAGGIISTFAGKGTFNFSGDGGQATAAELAGPVGITIDGAGNVYIADESNQRVRKVNTSGIISTIAGDGIKGFSGDGGVATSAELNQPWELAISSTGDIFIADVSSNIVRELTNTTGINSVSNFITGVNAYPNPNNGTFTVQVQNINQNTELEICNVLGEQVYTTRLNSSNIEIKLNTTTPGIYLYKILTTDGQFISSGKLVVE